LRITARNAATKRQRLQIGRGRDTVNVCGIVGYVGKRDVTPVLIEGLHRLEYRGYDSAGLAVISRGRLQITKTAGRVQDLRDKLATKQAGTTTTSSASTTSTSNK